MTSKDLKATRVEGSVQVKDFAGANGGGDSAGFGNAAKAVYAGSGTHSSTTKILPQSLELRNTLGTIVLDNRNLTLLGENTQGVIDLKARKKTAACGEVNICGVLGGAKEDRGTWGVSFDLEERNKTLAFYSELGALSPLRRGVKISALCCGALLIGSTAPLAAQEYNFIQKHQIDNNRNVTLSQNKFVSAGTVNIGGAQPRGGVYVNWSRGSDLLQGITFNRNVEFYCSDKAPKGCTGIGVDLTNNPGPSVIARKVEFTGWGYQGKIPTDFRAQSHAVAVGDKLKLDNLRVGGNATVRSDRGNAVRLELGSQIVNFNVEGTLLASSSARDAHAVYTTGYGFFNNPVISGLNVSDSGRIISNGGDAIHNSTGRITSIDNAGYIGGANGQSGVHNRVFISTIRNGGTISGGEFGRGIRNFGSIARIENVGTGTIVEGIENQYLFTPNTRIGNIVNSSSNGSLVVRNTQGVIDRISNTNSGSIDLYNSQSASISNISSSSSVGMNIDNAGIISGNISNSGTGRISIINRAMTRGNINNSNGSTSVVNHGNIGGSVNNTGGSTSVVNHGNIGGNVSNTGGSTSIINNGNIGGNISNSMGRTSVTNNSRIGSIVNTQNGTLDVSNSQGASIGNIDSSGSLTNVVNSGSIARINSTGFTTRVTNNVGANITNITNANDETKRRIGLLYFDNKGNVSGNVGIHGFSEIINSGSIASTNLFEDSSNAVVRNNGGIMRAISNEGIANTIFNSGTGSINSIANRGAVSSIINQGRATITNIANSAVSANISNLGGLVSSIVNTGTATSITNMANIGSINNQRGTATLNNSSGTINTLSNSAMISIRGFGLISNIINAGTINGFDNGGFIGSLNNQSGGLIQSSVSITSGGGIGTITNAGTMAGGLTSDSQEGFKLTNRGIIGSYGDIIGPEGTENMDIILTNAGNSTLSNEATGTIFGNLNAGGDSSISVINRGSISGSVTNNSTGIMNFKNLNGANVGSIFNASTGTMSIVNVGNIWQNEFTHIWGNVTNQSTGILDVLNQSGGFIHGSIVNASTGTFYVSSEKDSVIEGSVINDSTGTLVVRDNKGYLGGTFVNNNGGVLTVEGNFYMNGSIENRGHGSTTITVKPGQVIDGSVVNSGTGNTNVENSGTLGKEGLLAVGVWNGSGTLNNHTSGIVKGNVSATGSGSLGVNNQGTITGDISTSGTGNSNITNQSQGVIRGNIINSSTGSNTITNQGTLVGSISNEGNLASLGNSGTIGLTVDNRGSINDLINRGIIRSSLNNEGTINNFVNEGTIQGAINNKNGATISTLENFRTLGVIQNDGSIGSLMNRETGTISDIFISEGGSLDQLVNQGTIEGFLYSWGTIGHVENRGPIDTVMSYGSISRGIDNYGSIDKLLNMGPIAGSIDNKSGSTIGTLYNSTTITGSISNDGFVRLMATERESVIGSLNIGRNGTLRDARNMGTIGSVDNQGILDRFLNQGQVDRGISNTGTISTLESTGTINGNIFNGAGSSIAEFVSVGYIHGEIENYGTIGIPSRKIGPGALQISGGEVILRNNTGAEIIGDVKIESATQAEIINKTAIRGNVIASNWSTVKLTNSGTIEGVASFDLSTLHVKSEEGSAIGFIFNQSANDAVFTGLTNIPHVPRGFNEYDIRNDGWGINIENLYLDLRPWAQSLERNQNLAEAYEHRLTLGGSIIDRINVDHITMDFPRRDLAQLLATNTVNLSQFIDGALGNIDREAHDCSTNSARCETITTEDGHTYKGYSNGTLIYGFMDDVGKEDFISIRGTDSFTFKMIDNHGNLSVVPTPQNSAGAGMSKLLASSMRIQSAMIDGVITSSVLELVAYLERDRKKYGDENEQAIASYNWGRDLYAALATDVLLDSRTVFKGNSMYVNNSAVYILPYFSSRSLQLDNGDTAKGNNRGLIAGYTGVTENDTFYSIYGGYEDADMSTKSYDIDSKSLYTGFKVFDHLSKLTEDAELFAQYDGGVARASRSIVSNNGGNYSAKPNSYIWSLGADLGVNYFVGENTFSPQIGLGYEGGTIDAYETDVRFDRTRFNTYHTRAKVSWTREWAPHFRTVVSAGLKYHFNPEIKYSYNLAGDKINGNTEFARLSESVGVDFVVPISDAFYLRLSYNGVFSKDENSHTGFAKLNYSF